MKQLVFNSTPRRPASPSVVVLVCTALLAGCGGSQSAFLDIGGGQTLSVVREQNYLGGPWRSTLVPAANARCQKRHVLEALTGDGFQLKVFRPMPGSYILNSGSNWYVTELENCNFQVYKSPPPYPGEPVGRFEVANQVLKYISAEPPKAAKP